MRHFLGIAGVEPSRLRALIERARDLRDEAAWCDALRHRAVALVFLEPSTRTRFSFEMACHRLGAVPLVFQPETSSATKGETVLDTVRALGAVGADALVIRCGERGLPARLAARGAMPVINAGDGVGEHPTQALLDLVTIRDHFDRFDGLTVGIVGDLAHSRVARSDAHALRVLGARVLLSSPPAMADPSLLALGCEARDTVDDVLPEADVLMMLRIQRERLGAAAAPDLHTYREGWALTEARAARLRDGAIVMHPGPVNRGVEIDDGVADGPRSVIRDQVAHGVYARMAVLLDVLHPECSA